MKTIKMRILVSMLALIITVILVTNITSIFSTYNSTLFALEESAGATAQTAAVVVESQLDSYRELAVEFSENAIIKQISSSEGTAFYSTVLSTIEEEAQAMAERHGLTNVYVANKDDMIPYENLDISHRDYLNVVKETKEPYVTDPLENLSSGELDMFAVAPILDDNGDYDGCVIIAIQPEIFSELISQISIGEGSTTAVMDSAGAYVAHTDVNNVYERTNFIEKAKTDSSLEKLAELLTLATEGNDGFGSYTYNGQNKFIAYAPIEGANGWSIYVSVAESVFLAQMYTSIIINIVLAAVSLVIAVVLISLLARNISKPVMLCADRLNKLVEGDLHSPVPVVNSKDEIAQLANSTKGLTDLLSIIITDIGGALEEMGNGNLAAESSAADKYVGDFEKLYISMEKIQSSLSTTLSHINTVSEQVGIGSQQVAAGAQNLAHGSTDQTSSIMELSETLEDITRKVSQTAQDSQKAKVANDNSQIALTQSQSQMNEMMVAMNNINAKSSEISKIIKAIDDIAFQTNILSLNAAVEAARAGTAGKGFAVVANEVRSLATKSAQSAKDTATLIEETVNVVSAGNKIANSTSKSIDQAIVSAEELSLLVDSIADACSNQAESTQLVSMGIDQISAVVQTNSATSEESAAASEQLSEQAQTLRDLVAKFQLADVEVTDIHVAQSLNYTHMSSMNLIESGDKY